jgi:hypothetical protein
MIMQTHFFKIFICIASIMLLISSCYRDNATMPKAKFEVYKYDVNRNIIVPDSIFIEDRVLFVNTGTGDHFVIWPAEKRMAFSGSFVFTAESFGKMAQSLVPDSIIEALRFLEGQTYTNESRLSRAILDAIGGDYDLFYTYEYQIKSSAIDPPKNVAGNDSIRFTYNHDYLDFIHAEQKGYYNVTGWPLLMDAEKQYSREFIYRLPGRYRVLMLSTGVADFGATTYTDTISVELIVYPKQ